MRKLIKSIAFILAVLPLAVMAQEPVNGRIKGTVSDGSAKTIESATITLRQEKDSAVAKISIADKTGLFIFEGVGAGKYFVSISAIGHLTASSPVFEISETKQDIQLDPLQLEPQAKSMTGVTVTARRPLVEVKAGKMVVNVDAAPSNAGLNALELLEKSPGVSVDNDGNISLKGKQGVTILVDGKPTYMSGADLAALLKNMQSTNIDQVEIMTNPPAKYDAAGNSGIINIKTKKGIIKGMNGSVVTSYTQGIYGRVNGGINLNYRNDKLNIFGGYNGGRYEGFNRLLIDRKMYEGSTLARRIDQVSRPHFEGNYHNVKAGVDYYFSKRTVAGVVLNGNLNDNDEDPRSNTNVNNLLDPSGNYRLLSNAANKRNSTNFTGNFNFKHTIDSTGREITTDLDYARYVNKSKTSLVTQSFNTGGDKTAPDVTLNGDIPSYINIYSAKVDYVHPFKSGLKLEAGAKTSFVKTDNSVEYVRNNGGGWVTDIDRSNHFIYEENINAAYAIFSKNIKKWDLTAGLRLENTVAKGHEITQDSSFRRNYTNLFPNVGMSYNASEKHQLSLSYSRRITRPDYDDLNPFVFFLDSLTYGQGNPYLQPQFTNNFELSHTFNRFLTTTINYTQTNDIITEMLKQETEKNITYQTKDNFSSMKQWGMAVMANVPVRKWWNANFYVNVFNNHYSGLYQNDPVEIQFTTLMANMNNTFSFGKGWGAELSGWYRTKGAEGILVANEMGALNAGITKQVLKKKGMLKMGVRDIFLTQRFSGYARYSDVDVDISSRRDSRQFNFTFTFRFGKTNIAPERRRTSGASDEQNRVNTGGN